MRFFSLGVSRVFSSSVHTRIRCGRKAYVICRPAPLSLLSRTPFTIKYPPPRTTESADCRRTAGLGDPPMTGNADRRLHFWGGWGRGKDKEEAADNGGNKSSPSVAAGVSKLQPGLGGANLGAGGRGEKTKKGQMRPKGMRVATVPVSDTVDLTTDQEGFLWLPTSMSPPECSGTEDDASSCESTVRFCLMNIAEYQETPWKFPMAAMLQSKSLCKKADNLRAFRLSTLRVRGGEASPFFFRGVNPATCGIFK